MYNCLGIRLIKYFAVYLISDTWSLNFQAVVVVDQVKLLVETPTQQASSSPVYSVLAF